MTDVNACFGTSSLLASSKCLSRLFCLYSKIYGAKIFALIITTLICAKFWSVPFL